MFTGFICRTALEKKLQTLVEELFCPDALAAKTNSNKTHALCGINTYKAIPFGTQGSTDLYCV